MLWRFLLSFGTAVLITNAVIYIEFYNSIRWHGAVQITLVVLGAVMALTGLALKRGH